MANLCVDVLEMIIGLNPIVYSTLNSIKPFHDAFILENKSTEFWKKKFGYKCYLRAPPQDVDDGRAVVWKYRNSVLGPKYIPFESCFNIHFGVLDDRITIIGRAVIRKWRDDIEGVPHRQILHCSGAMSESFISSGTTSYLECDVENGLTVIVIGWFVVKNIKVSIDCAQMEKRWNIASNKIHFSRKFGEGRSVCVTHFAEVVMWRFVIEGKAVVLNGSWNGFCDSVKERHPGSLDDVTTFFSDLGNLLQEQPRLTSFRTAYDDHVRPHVSIPKVNFWREDFSCPP